MLSAGEQFQRSEPNQSIAAWRTEVPHLEATFASKLASIFAIRNTTFDTIIAMAAMLGCDPDDVLDAVFHREAAQNADLIQWRQSHPETISEPTKRAQSRRKDVVEEHVSSAGGAGK